MNKESDDHQKESNERKTLTRIVDDLKDINPPTFYRRHFVLHQTGELVGEGGGRERRNHVCLCIRYIYIYKDIIFFLYPHTPPPPHPATGPLTSDFLKIIQLALRSVVPKSPTVDTTPTPATTPTPSSTNPMGIGAGEFSGPIIDKEKSLHSEINSNFDNSTTKNSMNKPQSNPFEKKLQKIVKNGNFTVQTKVELIRELFRKKKIDDELQKNRETLPPANSVFLSTGGGVDGESKNNDSSNITPEGKVPLSKRDRRGIGEHSDVTTETETDSETETESIKDSKDQKNEKEEGEGKKRTKDHETINQWTESIKNIKSICRKNKMICPYKKLIQARGYLSSFVSTKIGRKAGAFRLMKNGTLVYTNKKTMQKFSLTKLLATLSFRTDSLFQFLNLYQPPVRPYSRQERFFIKTLVKASSFPIHAIPSQKVQSLCKE